VRCTDGLEIEQDCPAAFEQVGPACLANGRSDCGGATCATDGEYTCAGTKSSRCDSGITEVRDCSKIGMTCATTLPGCVGIPSGTCTAGMSATCDGDTSVTCDASGTQRRQDCSVFGGRTCVAGRCAFGSECATTTVDKCVGTTFTACIGGVTKSIDCTTIGATTCASTRCQ
jgi:hypothetical protein